MGKTRIAAAIAKFTEVQSKRTELNADYVINNLREIVQRSMNPEEGQKPNLHAANRALELLRRHLAILTDKLNVQVQPVYEDMLKQLE